MSILEHLAAIQCELTADEIGALRRYLGALSPLDGEKLIVTLQTLAVDDALALIRSELDLAAEHEAGVAAATAADAAGQGRLDEASARSTSAEATDTNPRSSTQPVPAVAALSVAHIVAIEAALAPGERQATKTMLAAQSPGELSAWFTQLLALSVADGAALVREAVAKNTSQPS